MCTTIAEHVDVRGSAKGPNGWFAVARANVGYDHPVHASVEHAILLDLVDGAADQPTRVAVELDRISARELAERILHTLEQADAYEGDTATP